MEGHRRIAFVASSSAEAESARARLAALYGDADPAEADVIVALGGDGHMIQTLHRFMNTGKAIYGMHRGTVGFLMNEHSENGLPERLEAAEATTIRPLAMTAIDTQGRTHEARAINEVAMLRQTYQTAKLSIAINDKVRLEELVCDGVLVATPAGSTAYNLSAHGPILPIDAPLLALTPISAFRPRRWRGALLSNEAKVTVQVLEAEKRPVSAAADHVEFRSVCTVHIEQDPSSSIVMLFDPGHSLDERILSEQFGF